MKQFIAVLLTVLGTSSAFAKVDNECVIEASQAVVDYLNTEDVDAQAELVIDKESNEVISIKENYYENLWLVETNPDMLVFVSDDEGFFISVNYGRSKKTGKCYVGEIDSGQADPE